jgi:hypothetical protein
MTARRFLAFALTFFAGFALCAVVEGRVDLNRLKGKTPPAVAAVLVRGPLSPHKSLPVVMGQSGEAPEGVPLRDGDGLIRVTILDEDSQRHAFVVVPAR